MKHSNRGRRAFHSFFMALTVWCVALFLMSAAHGADKVVDASLPDVPFQSLTDHFSILEDASRTLTFADLQKPGEALRFSESESTAEALNFGYTRSAYWLRLTLANPGDQALQRMLEIRYPGLTSIELYRPAADGRIEPVSTGSVMPFSGRPYANRFFVFPLTVSAHTKQTLYLRVFSNGPISIPAYLWKTEAFHAYERDDYSLQAWYFGIAAAMLVFNLLLYVALRDVSYLLYVIFVTWMSLTIAAQAGLAKEFLWNDAPLWSNIASSVSYALSLASLLVFMRHFLNTRKVIAHSDYFVLPLIGLYLIAPIGFGYSLTTFIKPAAMLYAATGVLILFMALWCAYKRQRNAYFFLTAFGALCIAAIVTVLRATGALPTNHMTVNALQLGSGAEMLLLAFALADRFNEIRKGKVRAQAETLETKQLLVETLQDSERVLENRVRLRTLELDLKNAALTQAMSSLEMVERIARHDLKTPLGCLATAPGLLREKRAMSAQEEAILCMMESAANRALRMVNLSLDLFRMESGTYTCRPVCVDLRALIESVIQDLGVQASSKKVAFRVIEPDAKVVAQGEEELCYSIIANLVKNAVEAALPSSTVTISLANESQAILTIHNDGVVPPDLRDKFFEKYSTAGKLGGTGLGTYSSHLLAVVQGGKLTMETSESSGTTLTLLLDQWRGAEAVVPVDEVPTLPAQRVLVVDNDEFTRMILLEQLAQSPLDVKFAINGSEAVEMTKHWRADVIVMDIEMPVLGGMDALLEIRAFQSNFEQAPSVIVAHSGHDDVASCDAFIAHGFDQCLKKPSAKSELFALLRLAPV